MGFLRQSMQVLSSLYGACGMRHDIQERLSWRQTPRFRYAPSGLLAILHITHLVSYHARIHLHHEFFVVSMKINPTHQSRKQKTD